MVRILLQLFPSWMRVGPLWMIRTLRDVQLPDRDVPGYRELADLLRDEIAAGRIAAGARFPSETDLRHTYGLARDTVRLAVAMLRAEGLIVVRHGQPTIVRRIYDKALIDLEGVESIGIRMPNPTERQEKRIDEGVPVWVVKRVGRSEPEVLPGDRWEIEPGMSND
jgi:DNA-binding transcriptional MocR family regulator